jgi:DNA replication protein DnaC
MFELCPLADLVILDELGYLPFRASGGALLFHLPSKLYERTSMTTHSAHLGRPHRGDQLTGKR